MPVIQALEKVISSGSASYPIYIGFLDAAEILRIAEAPDFKRTTQNDNIASNILAPPIRQWQRPLSDVRVSEIAQLFNNTGQFMPNPVLLSENVAGNIPGIQINQQQASGQILTNIWEITVPYPVEGQEKPLWILDGQHRINGLATSAQADNQIPVVLLLNKGHNFYVGATLAKIFAQVTTTAQGLDDLHNEWLTFAFALGAYSPTNSNHGEHRQAMECVAELCKRQYLGSNNTPPTNAFFNQIKFNHFLAASPAPGGFSYTCIELKEIIRRYYYSSSSSLTHLSPTDLAVQIGLAHHALTTVVPGPQASTVFFGTGNFEQKIIQNAFLIGVLSLLLTRGIPSSWQGVLQTLQFPTTNWTFSWVRTLNGSAGSISKNLAFNVFSNAFKALTLPNGNLADALRGNNAYIDMRFQNLSPQSGRPVVAGKTEVHLSAGNRTSQSISPRTFVKVVSQSDNVGSIQIMDRASPLGRTIYYPASGFKLDSTFTNPLLLSIRLHHYGGNEADIELDVAW